MTEPEKRVPELRFKDFVDDWEQRKFEDGTSKIGDGLHGTPEYTENGEVAFINGNNLVNGKIVINDQTKFVTSKQQSKADAELNENTILMSINGTIGNLAWYKGEKLMLGKSAAFIEVKSFHKKFIYQLLQTHKIKNYFLNNLTGTTIKNLGLKTIRETPILVPNSDEQEKVGSFFERLDDTIALHQRKLDLLNQLKQTFLQVMFPKNEGNVPTLRFAGFSEPWEQHKLGELAYVVGGGTPSTSTDDYWNGNINWYSPAEIGNQIFVKGSQKRITKAGLQKSSAKILPVGTVLFTSRAGIGKTAILAKEGATNQGFQSIVPHENELDSYFIYSRTHELKQYGETIGAGSTFIEVSGKQMVKMPILTPPLEEQTKIGFFFKQLDNNIGLQQGKLENLLELKFVLLGKMFI
ncbi:restriction endonuclease subunit S [Trichococcus sp. K1Tr]|uniref:restriction endonuclease subunit S n=1 Tax=Trichococcus sp. K1Tr TaxID=3020847 RepID=UPI00232C0D1F|nr:restriction endonuclease subunit S [Trichococcus sp. K1Tr]MDB6353912.1 restriction endonuclease subunit S [Trichococcus sp. K1Tr]